MSAHSLQSIISKAAILIAMDRKLRIALLLQGGSGKRASRARCNLDDVDWFDELLLLAATRRFLIR